jgi:hypothetical protein
MMCSEKKRTGWQLTEEMASYRNLPYLYWLMYCKTLGPLFGPSVLLRGSTDTITDMQDSKLCSTT